MTSNNNSTDDGSLSFLNIQPDEANKHFNCPETFSESCTYLLRPLGKGSKAGKVLFQIRRRHCSIA